jgi:hypothetical protein
MYLMMKIMIVAYVKQDSDNFIHLYQENVDDDTDTLWNYVKMSEDFDVITETTVNVDDTCVPNSAQ